MTSADTPPDVRGPRFLEPLPYESASETANLRWIVRMLALLMIGHAVSGVATITQSALLGLSLVPPWLPAMRLPAVILFGVAAVLMVRMRRGAFVAIIAAYSYNAMLLAVPMTFILQRFISSQGGASVGLQIRISIFSGGFSVVTTILEAVAIIAIVARCRRAGALN